MKTLHIIRGASGSGKSTLAAKLTPYRYEADSFFERGGVYKYDPAKIKKAHAQCQADTEAAMRANLSPIAVANTFTRKWEVEPYLDMAERHGYHVEIHHCTGRFQNVHGVPEDVVERMRNNFEELNPPKSNPHPQC